MSKIEILHKTLIDEYNKTNKDLKMIDSIIREIEVELKKPNTFIELNPVASTLIHKDVFEISTLFALFVNNLTAFEAHASKAVCFYRSQIKGESQSKYLIIGLYLMHLLSTNRISEFHMLIEQIDETVQQMNPYINTAMAFEQFVTEGAYNKILLHGKALPHPLYTGFVQSLVNTIRQEVAMCMESSHKSMPIDDAATMLLFEEHNDVIAFGKQCGWKLENNSFIFYDVSPMDCCVIPDLDTKRIIEMHLAYAKHLEMII